MKRKLMAVTILVFWFGMVGWQVRREYFQPELTRLANAALSLAPGVEFYTLRMGDRTIGQATSRLDTLPEGFELEDVMVLDLPALGQTGTAVVRTVVNLSPSLVMDSFTFSLDSEIGRFQASGVLGADSTLRVVIVTAGEAQEVSYKMAEPPIFASVVSFICPISICNLLSSSVRFLSCVVTFWLRTPHRNASLRRAV